MKNNKRQQLVIKRQYEQARSLILEIPGTKTVALYDENYILEKINNLRRTTFSLASQPSSHLDIQSTTMQHELWLSTQLREIKATESTEIILFIDQFEESFLVIVSVDNLIKWVSHFWSSLTIRSFTIWPKFNNELLVFSEEEHYFEVFKKRYD